MDWVRHDPECQVLKLIFLWIIVPCSENYNQPNKFNKKIRRKCDEKIKVHEESQVKILMREPVFDRDGSPQGFFPVVYVCVCSQWGVVLAKLAFESHTINS